MKTAVTSLSSLDYCPRKLFLEKVLKIVEIPKEAVVKGSVRHEAHDEINKAEKELVASIKPGENYKQILEKYKARHSSILRNVIARKKTEIAEAGLEMASLFKEAWKYIEEESKERALLVHGFIQEHEAYGEELWEILTPKITSEEWIESEKLRLRGIIDQVRVYEKEIVPFELKTGKAPMRGVWPGHKLQIGAYMMMLKEQGKNIKEGVIRYLDLRDDRPVILDPFLEEKVKEQTEKVFKVLNNDELPGRINNMNKCNACSLKEKCYNDCFMQEKMEEKFGRQRVCP